MEKTDSRNGGRADRSSMDAERTVHNGCYRSTTLSGVTIRISLLRNNSSVVFAAGIPQNNDDGEPFPKKDD